MANCGTVGLLVAFALMAGVSRRLAGHEIPAAVATVVGNCLRPCGVWTLVADLLRIAWLHLRYRTLLPNNMVRAL